MISGPRVSGVVEELLCPVGTGATVLVLSPRYVRPLVVTSALCAQLLLLGCGGGGGTSSGSGTGSGGGTGSTAPPITDTQKSSASFAFVRHALPGVTGAAAIGYQTPPAPVGAVNDGKGNLTAQDLQAIGLDPIIVYPRAPYDVRVADFNGDGIPDVISSVYSPTNVESWAYLFYGQANGTYVQDPSFGMQYVGTDNTTGYRGRTETSVVADFNNDGAVDIFLPTYTYLNVRYDLSGDPSFSAPGPPPNVHNAKQSFLLLNDGAGHFAERAVTAGVSMHAKLSGLLPDSTDPDGNQPEGAQAVDINMDGLIDLYVGGHMFINQGVDAQGVPHFKDIAATWGLTQAVLRAAPPWAPDPSNEIQPTNLLTDEGAKFIDWNNDGQLDLLLLRWSWGPAHGVRLFEFTGSQFIERQYASRSVTPTCKSPPAGRVPVFSSSRPKVIGGGTAGINAYDLDGDGLEDILVTGDANGSVMFRNNGCGFDDVPGGDLAGREGGSGAMALADLDGDGTMDIIYPAADGVAYYENMTPQSGGAFVVEVLGPNGEHNQFGRVLQVHPPGTPQIFTRAVDGGSGYLTQNQYPLLIGTPFAGAHQVQVYFAPLTACLYGGPPCHATVLSFAISPGQHAQAYAPSAAHPGGYAVIK